MVGPSGVEESFKVFVRIRPLNSREVQAAVNSKTRSNASIIRVHDNLIHIVDE